MYTAIAISSLRLPQIACGVVSAGLAALAFWFSLGRVGDIVGVFFALLSVAAAGLGALWAADEARWIGYSNIGAGLLIAMGIIAGVASRIERSRSGPHR